VLLDGSGSSDPTNDPLLYTWTFGDGTAITNTTIVTTPHTYIQNGLYTVTLNVDDQRGATNTALTTVAVSNLPPTAVGQISSGPYDEGLTSITFDGSGSSDPGVLDILSYTWNFGDNSSMPISRTTHIYGNNGTYEAVLTVQDDAGATGAITLPITVQNVPPTAVAAANVNGKTATFDSSGSSDPGNDTLSYIWDFGDNSPSVSTNSPTVNYSYASKGTYTATLTVNDGDGGVDTDTVTVTVQNSPPTAAATINNPPPLEGKALVFNGIGSNDPDNDPLTYSWNFGGGSTATGVTANHTFAAKGIYPVTLTVNDGDGGVNTATITVTVQNAPPTANAGGPYIGVEASPILFDGSGSSDPGNDPLTYTWNFGDNITVTTVSPTINHTYADNGTYSATLTVDDGAGGVDTTTVMVDVQNVNPTVTTNPSVYTTTVGVPVSPSATGSDVAGPADPLTYAWDLDNNGSFEQPGQTVTFTPTTTGTFTIAVQVDDGDGGTAIDTAIVQVNSLTPLAGLGGMYLIIQLYRTLVNQRKRRKKRTFDQL
jgi:PKD repeat protein